MDRELTYIEDAVAGKMGIWLNNLAGSLSPNKILDFVKLKTENEELKKILNPVSIKDSASFVALSERLSEADVGFHILRRISPSLGRYVDT